MPADGSAGPSLRRSGAWRWRAFHGKALRRTSTAPGTASSGREGALETLTTSHVALLLLGAGVLGALLPLQRRWSERGLHLFVALAAGIFLGTIFLHLLPHLAGGEVHEGHDHGPVTHGLGPWVAALAGLLLLFAIERVWLRRAGGHGHHHGHHHHKDGAHDAGEGGVESPHSVLWVATLVGLSLHAATAGFAYAGALKDGGLGPQFLASILLHKATETFSLATVLRLAGMPLRRALTWLGLFTLVEPAGVVLGSTVLEWSPELDPLLTGFALGTFLYVAVCDLLPEVFHGAKRPGRELLAVLAGIGVTAASLGEFEFGAQVEAALGSSWSLYLQMAPLLLVGFLLAGVVKRYLSTAFLARKMGGDDLKSVAWASALGAPLPLCSCSVVPVAMALRKGGASKGATSAFTISTPETGVDSIAASWSLLGPFMTVVRPIAAVITAFASGAAVNLLVRSGLDREPAPAAAPECPKCEPAAPAEPASCCAQPAPAAKAAEPVPSCCAPKAPQAKDDCRADDGHAHGPAQAAGTAKDAAKFQFRPGGAWPVAAPAAGVAAAALPAAHEHAPRTPAAPRDGALRSILRHAYVDVLDDVAPSLLVGLLVAGVVGALLPLDAFDSGALQGTSALFLMLVVGIPLYVCASASTPIAATLLAKGLAPGAALVFMLAGPATNTATIFVLARQLGWRCMAVQLFALCATTLALGALVNAFAPATVAAEAAACVHGETGALHYASAALLGALLVVSLVRTRAGLDLLDDLRARA